MGLARRVLARRGKFWPLLPDVARVYTGGNSYSTATCRHGQSLSSIPKRKKLFWIFFCFFWVFFARLCFPNVFFNELTFWPIPARKRSFANATLLIGKGKKDSKQQEKFFRWLYRVEVVGVVEIFYYYGASVTARVNY